MTMNEATLLINDATNTDKHVRWCDHFRKIFFVRPDVNTENCIYVYLHSGRNLLKVLPAKMHI